MLSHSLSKVKSLSCILDTDPGTWAPLEVRNTAPKCALKIGLRNNEIEETLHPKTNSPVEKTSAFWCDYWVSCCFLPQQQPLDVKNSSLIIICCADYTFLNTKVAMLMHGQTCSSIVRKSNLSMKDTTRAHLEEHLTTYSMPKKGLEMVQLRMQQS